MLDYSYWALCSAGIITIISYSTGREKYKTATAQESDQHRKEKEDKQANHTVYTQYQSWEACPKNESWDWYLRTTLESSSDGTSIICFGEFRPSSSSSSSDPSSDWRHGLNLMANQLPKQSWLHEFCTKRNLSRGRSWKTCWWTWTLIWWGWSQAARRPKGLSCHWRLFDLTEREKSIGPTHLILLDVKFLRLITVRDSILTLG